MIDNVIDNYFVCVWGTLKAEVHKEHKKVKNMAADLA